jgi:hypothetical protein
MSQSLIGRSQVIRATERLCRKTRLLVIFVSRGEIKDFEGDEEEILDTSTRSFIRSPVAESRAPASRTRDQTSTDHP